MSLAKQTVYVEGMSCAACVRRVEEGLKSLHGVASASVNFATSKAFVEYDPAALDEGSIRSRIEELGYGAQLRDSRRKGPKAGDHSCWWNDLRSMRPASGKCPQLGPWSRKRVGKSCHIKGDDQPILPGLRTGWR